MIFSTGIDIVQVDRIERLIKDDGFINKVYTESEKLYLEERKYNCQTAAGLFAAKEAVSKALGTGIRGFNITDIEILRDNLGKPYVILHNKALDIKNNNFIKNISISISHEKQYAVAISISEVKDK